MYITEFEITDLRCFEGTQSISLDRGQGTYAGWTVFAGRNGSGKSTLLKALALACPSDRDAIGLVGVFQGWVRQGCDAAFASVGLAFEAIDAEAAPIAVQLVWERQSRQRGDHFYSELRTGRWNGAPRGFFAGFGPYRHLGPTSPNLDRFRDNPKLDAIVNLFYEDATLSDAVDWLKDIHARALEKREGAEQLRADALAILADGLLPDDSLVKFIDSDGLWIERDGLSLQLEQVSDGYRTVAAMVIDLVRHLHRNYGHLDLERSADGHVVCKLPGVVLIDEVDAHMHVSWQQKIGFWLTSRFPNIQFLVTTHSPFICQAASPRGIIRLPAPGEDRGIEHVEGELFNAIVNGGVDDAVMSELFGLDHAHSAAAERLRRQIAALEGQVLRGRASADELAEYEQLRAKLPSDLGELARQRLRALARG